MAKLMDAREHYDAAHQWLQTADESNAHDDPEYAKFAVARAQAHATLALVAVQAPGLAMEGPAPA